MAIFPPYKVAEEARRWVSRGRERRRDFWSFTVGSRMYGSRTIWPEFGSGKAIKARVPVIPGELGLMPHPTQPVGEMKVPKKTRSKVAFWGWKVHAIEACWVGSVMHFWKVLVAVTVVQWAENATPCRWEERRKRKIRRSMVVVASWKSTEELNGGG